MAFDQADFFFVPLLNGQHGIGQIFEINASDTGAAFCGLSLKTAAPGDSVEPLRLNDIVAFVLIDPAQFHKDRWPIGGFDRIPNYDDVYEFSANKALGFPDNPQHDPAVIEAFLSACHGLYAWTAFGDLFDKIHRSDIAKPQAAIG